MSCVADILARNNLLKEDIVSLLSVTRESDIEAVRHAAEQTLFEHCGNRVHRRGLVEVSNVCTMDCLYCGIRRGSAEVERYTLDKETIVRTALGSVDAGYGSVVLQAGERRDPAFVGLIEEAVREIKRRSACTRLPNGLGITLSLGEQSYDTYERFFAAGAHRYLLRVESSNEDLFSRIHPPSQRLESRIHCLSMLRDIGYQVGTGVMIGLPGQTSDMLADDVQFFRDMDIDMFGMGPYIPHAATPLAHASDMPAAEERLRLSLLMIAVVRIVLKDVNIASTTALGTMGQDGRLTGLRFGANVIMPQMTPAAYRRHYLLYDGKPVADTADERRTACTAEQVRRIDRVFTTDAWGDSHHAVARSARSDRSR